MAEEFETLDMKNENTGEVESFTAADVTARAQIEELNETLTESQDVANNSLLTSLGESILPEADLNDYLTPGKYGCTSGARASTLLNCPSISSAFSMWVMQVGMNNNERFFQLIFPVNNTIYFRSYYVGEGWHAWRQVTTTTA